MNLKQRFASFLSHRYSARLTLIVALLLLVDFTASNIIKYNNTISFNQAKLRTQQMPLTADIIANDMRLRIEKVELHLQLINQLLQTTSKLNNAKLLDVCQAELQAKALFNITENGMIAAGDIAASKADEIIAAINEQAGKSSQHNRPFLALLHQPDNTIIVAQNNRKNHQNHYRGLVAVFEIRHLFPTALVSVVEDKADFYFVTRTLDPIRTLPGSSHYTKHREHLTPEQFNDTNMVVKNDIYYLMQPSLVSQLYVLVAKDESQVLSQIKQSFISVVIIDFLVILLTLSAVIACIGYFTNLLQQQANTDNLTKVSNRQALEHFIKTRLAPSRRKSVHTLLLIDIDYFKKVNDIFGHLAGDSILKGVAQLLMQNSRDSDFLCRWGGEEFILLACDTELEQGLSVAEKVRAAIAEHVFDELPPEHHITISIGVATYNNTMSFETATQHADEALYQAKDGGRNQVKAYS